ncbi:hypothetical protein ACS0TY_028645 [Phlomoides rotata]
MDGSGNSGLGDGEKGKIVRNRRSWSKLEEDALVLYLVEIVNNGWKDDNGFKARFQRELEKGMRALLPGIDIIANPHINSKDYGSLFDALSKTGIGWNWSTNTLEIIDEWVWESKKKADPHVKGMRFKSWSYYLQWQDIFGKDRATREHTADAMDIVNDMLRSTETGEFVGLDKKGLADNVPEQVEENTPVSKPTETAVKKGKRIKRKACETEMTALVSTLGKFMKRSDETFGNIAQRMGNQQGAKAARVTLNDIMKEIPGLLLQEKLKVSSELVQNNNRPEYFLSLPPNEQAEYVIMLLDGCLK